MGADPLFTRRRRRRLGQSLIEFSFLVPLIITMLVALRQVEMVINTSIVNMKYARATAHFLLFNHRWYPETNFLSARSGGIYFRRWWVGVDDKQNKSDNDDTSPTAPQRMIGKKSDPTPKGDGATGTPSDSSGGRKNVRVRSSVFMCLPPYGDKTPLQFSEDHLTEQTFLTQGYKFCQD